MLEEIEEGVGLRGSRSKVQIGQKDGPIARLIRVQ
jgi:hypothetical protein